MTPGLETTSSRLGERCSSIVSFYCIAAILLSGCTDLSGPDEQVITMDVAAQRVPCMGLVPQECFSVRQEPDSVWTLFYEPIEGFEFEPGFEFTIRVAVRTVRNPPADGSSLAYRLLEILRKVPA
jgi:hypothetical protein